MTEKTRQSSKSKQPRFSSDQAKQLYSLMEQWIEDANLNAPAYGANSRLRDQWLRAFLPREPLLHGVIKSTVNVDKNRGWTLTGGRNQVRQYTSVLREADNGAGWRRYIALQSLSYYTANIGAITELGFDTAGGNGPLRQIWNVDPARCELTGKLSFPIRYYPLSGKVQDWKPDWYMRAVSMESTDEAMFGLGRCAVDMALELATIMVAIWRHDKEMLFAKMQKGILLMQGISDKQWQDAMVVHQETLTSKEREFFSGLSILFGDNTLDAKLVALSQLWDGFTLQEWANVLMNGYSLIMGYDTSEFWPVSSGALGRGTETEVQALKATGKGGLDFILAYQDNLQRELPESLQFEFDQRNEEGDKLEAGVAEAWGRAINAMSQPAGSGTPETLTTSERRQLLAQHGLIPDDWTIEEEEETSTDTDTPEERAIRRIEKRALGAIVARQMFPDQPILRYHWPSGAEDVLWSPPSVVIGTIKKRTIGQVVSEYRDRLENLVYNAFNRINNGLSKPGEMQTAVRTEHKRIIKELAPSVYVEGLREGGVDEDEIDDADKEAIKTWASEQASYCNGFAADVAKAAGDADAEAAILARVDLWVQSLETLGGLGYASAKANMMVTWKLNAHHVTNEHCPSEDGKKGCIDLDGQRHRMKWFTDKGYIPRENGSATLRCGGWECGCGLVDDDEVLVL